MVRASLLIAVVLAAVLYVYITNLIKPLPAPLLDTEEYWGSGDKKNYKEDVSIQSQEIFYSDATIERLKSKLNSSATLHPPLEGINHEYGINSIKLLELIEYWRNVYMPKWPERLEYLNNLPHFLTEIQGLRIHFVHSKPKVDKSKTVIPLLLLHGWPGSVREFYELIPMLTDGDSEVVFEVIAPSLPGFGWSEGSSKIGFGPAQIAVVLRNLMIRLGHTKFLIQGGDFGAIIGSDLAALFPQNVIGYHSNFCNVQTGLSTAKLFISSLYPTAFIDEKYQPQVFPLLEKFTFLIEATGYYHIQATKPDTIGLVLTGNPIGLAAYLYEPFLFCFPSHSNDEILDNIMIYHLTNSITTTFRLYAEAASRKQNDLGMQRVEVTVPTGCTRFPVDVMQQLDWQLTDKYVNLVHSTWQEKGGHFAAMEVPEILYRDFLEFVNIVFVKN